jgi:hypothetical protein
MKKENQVLKAQAILDEQIREKNARAKLEKESDLYEARKINAEAEKGIMNEKQQKMDHDKKNKDYQQKLVTQINEKKGTKGAKMDDREFKLNKQLLAAIDNL